jgi:DNA-binding transcriptional regulator YiaG
MARDLGVNDRTVRRWAAGDDAPKPGVYDDLARLVRERISALKAISPIISRCRNASPAR